MRKFTVFCLSSVGAITLLAGTAAAGAAGLWMYTVRGGCDTSGDRALTHHMQWVEVVEGDAVPVPVPGEAPAIEAPVVEAREGIEAEAMPAPLQPDDQMLALKAQLAAALQRIAELEGEAEAPGATPETPAAKRSGGDF
jgi:hypothetical protein